MEIISAFIIFETYGGAVLKARFFGVNTLDPRLVYMLGIIVSSNNE